MKTKLNFLGALFLLCVLGACEKDEIETVDPQGSSSADLQAAKNYNNGMIKSYSNETVLIWNEFLSGAIDAQMPQPLEAKIYAMVTLAMHDALNNVVPKYETYALDNIGLDAGDISKKNIHSIADAAVSLAARDMIVELYPDAQAAADELLTAILSKIEDSDLKTRGILIGQDAAAAVFEKRANDFPLGFETFVGPAEPGDYQSNWPPFINATPMWPANAVYAPKLGDLTPFGALSGDQFRNETPYALNSAEYIADYNEVKSLGCPTCPLRTSEQTEIGAFWIESTASSMNRIARTLVEKEDLDGWEAARLIALVEMAVMDGYIASFEGKYYFNFWRPISAIKAGNMDGVYQTEGDTEWNSSFTTPPTPEFPSTHAYTGAAAAQVFIEYFKKDKIDLTVTSPYNLPTAERHLSSFSQMSYENAISRIYIGFHFRHAVEVGEKQGKELGEYIFKNNLQELKKVL